LQYSTPAPAPYVSAKVEEILQVPASSSNQLQPREIPMVRIGTAMTVASAAGVAIMLNSGPALSAGTYDGNWIMSAPPVVDSNLVQSGLQCPAIELPFQVTDNRIQGSWSYIPDNPGGAPGVVASHSRTARPVTGTVKADGNFTLAWMSFRMTGKFSGDQVEMHWSGECGPRVGHGSRRS
jgi:hypothetical protein